MKAGQVHVITGAACGIGRCLAESLLKEKAIVWALDISSTNLGEFSEKAEKEGWELRSLAVDVGDPFALREAVKQILSRDGRIDVWINNAGVSGLGPFRELSVEQFDQVIAVNLGGVVTGTRLALEHMEEKGVGTVVNIASVAGFVPAPFLTAYCATKHAVVGFTRSLREELRLRRSNVRLVLISPGFVDTAMLARGNRLGFPDWLRWMVSSPETVARAIHQSLSGGPDEVVPTWNGKLMRGLHTLLPGTTRRRASILLSANFKDWLLSRHTVD